MLKQAMSKLIFLISCNTQRYHKGLTEYSVILRNDSRKHYIPERSIEPGKENMAGSISEWHGVNRRNVLI